MFKLCPRPGINLISVDNQNAGEHELTFKTGRPPGDFSTIGRAKDLAHGPTPSSLAPSGLSKEGLGGHRTRDREPRIQVVAASKLTSANLYDSFPGVAFKIVPVGDVPLDANDRPRSRGRTTAAVNGVVHPFLPFHQLRGPDLDPVRLTGTDITSLPLGPRTVSGPVIVAGSTPFLSGNHWGQGTETLPLRNASCSA